MHPKPVTRRLEAAGYGLRHRPDTLALIAMVLARVKEDAGGRLASSFGRMVDADRRLLSELRFQSIVRAREARILARLLRRALPLVQERAEVAPLAQDLFRWTDDTRARWCFEYYGAAAPTAVVTETKDETVS